MRLQDLPRHLARRCLGVPRFCRTVLGAGLQHSTLVVAYSTGRDSTALLHILVWLRHRLNLRLVAAHVHHGLRPESDAELEHALATCAALGVHCITRRVDVAAHQTQTGQGREEAARNLRYAFLEEVRAECNAQWIVTAHHGDDLAEDVLMRLVRGTGWPGLGGMAGVDARRHLLRPLLDWTKDELHDLLRTVGADWNEDASNANRDRTRNRLRHEVLPLLHRENPALIKTVLHLWRQANLDRDYWEQHVEGWISDGMDMAAAELLRRLPPSARLRLYKAILDRLGPGQALAEHLFRLDAAWTNGVWDTEVQFPGDKRALVEKVGISFQLYDRHQKSDPGFPD